MFVPDGFPPSWCTTTDPSDDSLVPIVEAEGCSVFRGSVDDIILRFNDAIARFGFDAVIQADGDDPLSATEYMDATMERLLADPSLDIVTVTGVPLGTATKSFTAAAMAKVMAAYRTARNDTGFIYFFTKSGLCRHLSIEATEPDHRHDTARLTLDYESDLALFRRVFDALYRPDTIFGLAEVVRFLRAHPDVIEINRHVEKEYWARTAEKAVLEYAGEDGALRRIPV